MISISNLRKLKGLIHIPPHFATLIAETDEAYVFKFIFKISKVAIVKKNLSKIVVKCINSNVVGNPRIKLRPWSQKSGPKFTTTTNFNDPKYLTTAISSQPAMDCDPHDKPKLFKGVFAQKKPSITQIGKFEIENIQFKHLRQLKKAEAKQNSILSEGVINLGTYISSTLYREILSDKNVSEIDELYSIVDTLEYMNEFQPIESTGHTSSDIKEFNLEVISKYSLHPIEIVNSVLSDELDLGYQIRQYYKNDAIQQLANNDGIFVPVKKKKFVDRITIPIVVTIPKNLVSNNIDVHFEIYQRSSSFPRTSRGNAFRWPGIMNWKFQESVIEKKVVSTNIMNHLKFFRLPKVRPRIERPTVDNQEIIVEHKDAYADYIKIEKKQINNRGECSNYLTVSETENLPIGESISVDAPIPQTHYDVFRCFSGNSNSTIINPKIDAIVSNSRFVPIDPTTLVILDSTSEIEGITFLINNRPSWASQFQILKSPWDGSQYVEPFVVIPYQNFDGKSTKVYYDGVKTGDMCLFYLMYKTVDGTVRHSVTQHHLYVRNLSPNIIVDVTQPEILTINNELQVSFIINDQIIQTSADNISAAVKSVDNDGAIKEQLNSSENISQLPNTYFHKVSRVNLSSGEREYFTKLNTEALFGAIGPKDIKFIDTKKDTEAQGLKPLNPMDDYIYEIRTYERKTASLIKNLVQKTTLPQSSLKNSPKSFYFKPHKWRQACTTDDGTIPAFDENSNLLTKKEDEMGEIGVSTFFQVSAKNQYHAIDSFKGERIDENKIKLSWNLVGDYKFFDHLVLIKQINDVKNLVGAIMGKEMIDILEPGEVGTIVYYLVPVFYNFSVGDAVKSNMIVIDPEEIIDVNYMEL